jgi:histidine transport system permease protein
MLKATALVSIIGLADVIKIAIDAGRSTYRVFFFTLVAAVVYLVLTTLSHVVLVWLERHYSSGVREAEL